MNESFFFFKKKNKIMIVSHIFIVYYMCITSDILIFDTFLWFLSTLVLSVSAKAWKTATDAPNVTI